MNKSSKKIKNKLKFLGNVPTKTFGGYLDDYYYKEKDLTPLVLKFQSKKRNIDLVQKIYKWIATTLTVGIIASGVLSLRKFASVKHSKEFSSMIGNWFVVLIAYLILLVILEIIIQSEKNTIYNQLELVKKKAEKIEEDKSHEKLVEKQ